MRVRPTVLGGVLLLACGLLLCPGGPAAAAARAAETRLVLGYYVPYDPTSWSSLEANARSIDVVAAQWVTVDPCGNLASQDDRTLLQFARRNGIKVVPSLLTLSAWLNHRLLTDGDVRANAIAQIVGYTVDEGYDGFDLDLEGVDPADRQALSDFTAELARTLHARGKLLTLAIPAKERDTTVGWAGAFDFAALGQSADLVTVMAYEYRGPFSGPGSVAPHDWVANVLAFSTSQIPPAKVLLGLAFYGYDWNVTSGGARSIGYPQAVALAEHYAVDATFEARQQSVTFGYEAAAGEPAPVPPRPAALRHTIAGRAPPPCAVEQPRQTPTAGTGRRAPLAGTPQAHEVWIEESTSAAARLALAETYLVGGVATWRLGQEDPNVWPLFDAWRRSRPSD